MSQRVPPNNLEAERSVLGGLLLDPESFDNVADVVADIDFYRPAHQKIFQTITELHRTNEAVDIVTVSNSLIKNGGLEEIGGAAYLGEILDQTPSAVNIGAYAKIIAEKSLARRLISTASRISERAYTSEYEDINSFLDEVESEVFRVAERRQTTGLVAASEVVKQSYLKIEELYNRQGEVTGVSSGFNDLDKMTAGFQPGELVIIAARPSMGKTAFALNIALHSAVREKKKVAFFSLEMGQQQLMMRLLSAEARIDMSNLKVGRVDDQAWPKLIAAASVMSESGLFIDDTSGVSPFEVRAKARRLKSQKGLDLIIIDYLQIMDLKQRVESRERAVAEISRMLKALAKELQVPVLALAQLNRGVESRTDRRPMLSDLRESGSIEQDADLILMLYRDEYYEKDQSENRGVAEVIIGKHRNGPVGKVSLAFLAKYGLFGNLAPQGLEPSPTPSSPSPQGGGYSAPQGGGGGVRRLPNFAPRPPGS